MENKDLISVIVPIYKAEKYLSKCIDSILAQTYTNFELLLVNDGSPDNSGKICDEYALSDSRIKVFHKENGGVSSARNYGLERAIGEWIFWIDSDDMIKNNTFEDCIDVAKKNNSDLVYFDFMFYNPIEDSIINCEESLELDYNDKISFIKKFINYRFTNVWNILAKRELYIVNNIKFDTGVSFAEDFDVAVRLYFFASNIIHLKQYLYYYNKSNINSILHNLSSKEKGERQNAILSIIEFFREQNAYHIYEEELCIRVLHTKQELLLDENTMDLFMQIHPESHKYITTCPDITFKLRLIMWLLTHKLKFIACFMVKAWKIVFKE